MADTVLDVLLHQAEVRRDALAYVFLVDGERQEIRVTFGQLADRARALAATLQGHRAAGKRAVLLFAPGIDYLVAFYGCLAAGVIAVPAYPPDPARLNRSLPRLRAMVADCQADIVLTTSDIHTMAQFIFQQAPELETRTWIAIDTIADSAADDWRMPDVGAESTAFLQYTSGSTGSPKGVVLSHQNLIHNLELITTAFRVEESTMGLSWLPPYHDMGLIGGILAPLYRGGATALMSPIAFLQKPFRWLAAISRFNVTISGGPNFAYELCLRKVTAEERDTLDLSQWCLAFSGAEPVRVETIERFAETFSASGFRREAFYPCYGLAEATLIVSGGSVEEAPVVATVDAPSLGRNEVAEPAAPASAHVFVGCGHVLGEQRVAIVDPATGNLCGPDEVGEIWVTGPSISSGYWQNPAETQRAFGNTLPDSPGRRFLRTGDLGFLRGGELFIAGRLKDLIIVRGRNLYPQDIERTVEEAHPTLRRGCSAAFAVDMQGDEQIVVVVEVERRHHDRRRGQAEPAPGAQRRGPDRRADGADAAIVDKPMPFDADAVYAAISAAVAEQHGIEPRAIVLLKGGSIPKTSSGKIQRQECKAGFLNGTLDEVARQTHDASSSHRIDRVVEDAPLSAESVLSVRRPERQAYLETWLKTHIGKVLGRDPDTLSVTEPITRFGLDSVMAIELSHALEKALGAILPVATLLRDASIRDVAVSTAATLGRSSSSTMPPRSISHEAFPLSRGQQALWFLYELDRTGAAYNVATAWRVRGPLDVQRLERAFGAVVERHPMLSVRIRASEGGAVQQFDTERRFTLERRDASIGDVDQAVVQAAREPFDLARDVMRVVLFSRSRDEHVLLLAAHHIALDFWSMVVVVDDLRAAFVSSGKLPPLVHDYRDFARYQQQLVEGPAAAAARAHWRRTLGDDLPVLELPTDRPRGSAETHVGASLRFALDHRVASVVRGFARAESRTLFTVLLAAYQACLCRWSGQTDVVVGAPLAGRTRAGFDRVVGYFVNVLPMRARIPHGTTFRELVGHVRDAALDAIEHEEFPLLDIVQDLRPPRLPGRPPLFQALFALEKSFLGGDASSAHLAFGLENRPLSLGDVTLEAMPLDLGAAQFDVSLTCVDADADGPISCILQYNTDLFDGPTMQTFVRTFELVLEHAVTSPDVPVERLGVLDSTLRKRALVEWNDTTVPVSLPLSIHRIVEAQVDRTPDAIALVVDDEAVTYAELDRRATAVAAALVDRGATSESIVGICLRRSVELIVAVLGVLKAGAAYLPLDPQYPDGRLQLMLEDSGARHLLAAPAEAARFTQCTAQVLRPEDVQPGPGTTRRPGRDVLPGQLAYVIYTSGSTGRPKGVQVPHASVANLLTAMMQEPAMRPDEIAVGVTSLSFDVSLVDLFLPFAVGARLVLARRDTAVDGARLRHLIESVGADVMQGTPSTWRLLLGAGWPRGRRLRALCAGEALSPALAASLRAEGAELWNLYGPTETTVYSSGELVGDGPITIGRPIANTELYIVDGEQEPLAPGIVGELLIGGLGVSRGYLARPALTAERFVPDPFGPQPGSRLYRTGDMARHRCDGRVEYVGRADHQVKLRGFRIELGEVEQAMLRHPSVAAAVATTRGEGDERALVGYFVARPESTPPTAAQLREVLRRDLPDYMVPSFFVALERLPLTANGKLDRAALPPPHADVPVAVVDTPMGPIELVLVSIMSDVLRTATVSPDASFFDLGGHSLLATQIIARIDESLGVRLPVATLFEHSSARALADHLNTRPDAADLAERAAIVIEILGMSDEEADRALEAQAVGNG